MFTNKTKISITEDQNDNDNKILLNKKNRGFFKSISLISS